MKWLLALGRFLFLLSLLAVALLYSEVGQGFLKGVIAGRLSLMLDKPVSIGRIELDFPKKVTAYDLRIEWENETPLRIDRIKLEAPLVSLLGSQIDELSFDAHALSFKDLTVEQANIQVHRDMKEQCWCYSGTVIANPMAKASIAGFFISEGERLYLTAEAFQVDAAGHRAFLQSRLNAYLDNDKFKLMPAKFVLANSTLKVEGSCSSDLIDAAIDWHIPSLEGVENIFPNSGISGKADLQLTVQGPLRSPDFDGEITVEDASYENFSSGALFHNIHAQGIIKNGQMEINRFSAQDLHEGLVTATGSLQIDQKLNFPFALDILMEKIAVVDLEEFNCSLSGKGRLEGDLHKAKISGDLTIDELQLTLTEGGNGANHHIDVLYINQEPGKEPTQYQKASHSNWPLALDLRLHSRGTIFISNSELTSQWRGDVAIEGLADAPKVVGDVKLESGEYVFNSFLISKKFKLTTGTISFHGDLKRKIDLYVVGEQEIAGIDAEVVVKGPLNDLAIAFRSTPPLPEKEILSRLLFGRGTGEISPFQGAELTESINKLKGSSGKGISDPLSSIKQAIGIDRIDLSHGGVDDSEQMSLQIGKYLAPGIFVGIKRGFTTETNRIGIEADLVRNVKLQAEVGDDAEGQFHLKWKKDY